MSFTVEADDGAARAGVLRTAHGEIRTPAFMPVGTKGTVKTLLPGRGALARRGRDPRQHVPPPPPAGRGRDRGARRAARVHAAGTGRSSPTPAASRCSRCATRSLRVDDDGVTFRSVYDGSEERLTPERVAEIQRRLGSDIAMCLDICPPADASRCASTRRPSGARSSGRSGRSTRRGPRASSASGSRRAAPTRRSARGRSRGSSALPFDGFALGGLAVGESRDGDARHRRLGGAAPARRSGRATSWVSATPRGSSR